MIACGAWMTFRFSRYFNLKNDRPRTIQRMVINGWRMRRRRGWVDCLADCFHIWSVVSLCWTQSRSTSSDRANGVILICMFCCCSEYVPKMQINVIPRTLYYTPRIFWLIRGRERERNTSPLDIYHTCSALVSWLWLWVYVPPRPPLEEDNNNGNERAMSASAKPVGRSPILLTSPPLEERIAVRLRSATT